MEKIEKLIKFLVKELVDDNSQTVVTYEIVDDTINFKVTVAEGQMGKLIGKNGTIANAIRGLVQASAVKEKINANVEFVD